MNTWFRQWREGAQMRGCAPAFRRKQSGIWQTLSWRDWFEQSSRLAGALARLGARPGDGVLVMCGNRFEWPVIDMAVQGLGAFVFGVHPCASAAELKHSAAVAAPRYVVAETARELAEIAQAGLLDSAHAVVVLDPSNAAAVFPNVLHFAALLQTSAHAFDDALGHGTAHALPTGELRTGTARRSLSFVSYANVAERLHQLACALAGGIVHFPENSDTIVNDMCEVMPDGVVAPDRFWRERRDEVEARVAAAGWPGRAIFRWATQPSRSGWLRRMLTRNVRRSIGLVHGSISTPTGSMDQDLADWYRALGVRMPVPAVEPVRLECGHIVSVS